MMRTQPVFISKFVKKRSLNVEFATPFGMTRHVTLNFKRIFVIYIAIFMTIVSFLHNVFCYKSWR